MNTRDTFGVSFCLRKNKQRKDGTIPVMCRITMKGERIELNTRVNVNLEQWREYQSNPLSRKKNLSDLRDVLRQYEEMVYSKYRELNRGNDSFSLQGLKRIITGVADKQLSIIQLSERFYQFKAAKVGSLLDTGTLHKYRTTFDYLKEFIITAYKSQDLPLSIITFNFIAAYETFVRQKKNNANNGTVNHLRRLKSMIEYGVNCGVIKHNPFNSYSMRIIPRQPVFLEWEELQRIHKKKFTIQRLEDVKNLFLFSCYTGLAFIDVQSLTTQNILKGPDGRDWIITRREKTNTEVNVPLLQQAQEILLYYQLHKRLADNNRLLPRISNQKMNAYLKEIADICCIQKPLTSHLGRFTFATTICAANNVPIDTAQKLLGHTKIQTTQHYYRTNRERIARDMQALQEKLYETLGNAGEMLNNT
jgi:integrase